MTRDGTFAFALANDDGTTAAKLSVAVCWNNSLRFFFTLSFEFGSLTGFADQPECVGNTSDSLALMSHTPSKNAHGTLQTGG
jgi:hypothetical protein